jgi:hypothetical protein
VGVDIGFAFIQEVGNIGSVVWCARAGCQKSINILTIKNSVRTVVTIFNHRKYQICSSSNKSNESWSDDVCLLVLELEMDKGEILSDFSFWLNMTYSNDDKYEQHLKWSTFMILLLSGVESIPKYMLPAVRTVTAHFKASRQQHVHAQSVWGVKLFGALME